MRYVYTKVPVYDKPTGYSIHFNRYDIVDFTELRDRLHQTNRVFHTWDNVKCKWKTGHTNYIHSREVIITEDEFKKLIVEMELTQ